MKEEINLHNADIAQRKFVNRNFYKIFKKFIVCESRILITNDNGIAR